MRKIDFHHLKRLQREEMKETTVFYHRIKGEREVQEKKSDLERQEVERRFEGVSDMMTRKNKKEVERLEQLQIQHFKNRAKTLKAEQVRIIRQLLLVWHSHTLSKVGEGVAALD
jgi:serine/threonine-protein kinase 10